MTGPASTPTPEGDVQMTFFEHLGELRSRLVRALFGIVPGVGLAWAFRTELLDILSQPLVKAWKTLGLGEPTLHYANLPDPFLAYMKLSLIVGLLASSPWIFWQLWSFISPGLYAKEKKYTLPFVFASTVCFAGGALFGYLVVFPVGFSALMDIAGGMPTGAVQIQPTIMLGEYLDFTASMLLAFGIVFELPVILAFLALARIVNYKQLLRFSRWWTVVAAILSAVLTPSTDLTSQILMLIPLLVLYYVGVLFAYILGARPPAVVEAPVGGDVERA